MFRIIFALVPLWSLLLGSDNGGTSTSDTPATGGEPGSNAQTGASTGGQPAAPQPKPQSGAGSDKTFTQADIDRIVQQRVAEEHDRAKRKADEEAAAKKGEWEKVATDRKAKIDELTPKAKAADRYAERLGKLVDDETATWPDEVKALDPGTNNLEARLDWLEKSRPLAKKLKDVAEPPKAPATETGSGNSSTSSTTNTPANGNSGTPPKSYRFQQPGDVAWT